MPEAHILMKMTLEKSKLIEEAIVAFLGHRPSWKERKAFRVMHRLGESSIYLKESCIGTVTYEPVEELVI